ncbi:MAG: 16S rRNA (uracil(1498)-N(3))-methyltransferase [Elusimicrobiota bacterium]
MQRFYVPPGRVIDGETIEISGSEAHHIKNVIRKKIGDVVFLFDGQGVEYEAEIERLRDLEIRVKIVSKTQRDIESKIKINLYQSLPKGRKFDFIVEKTTELGVSKIIPVISERSVIPSEARNLAVKQARWQKIALSAAKQCGRTVITEISPIQTFETAVISISQSQSQSLSLIPWECEQKTTLKNLLTTYHLQLTTFNLFIGPEGGFSNSEIELAKTSGIIPVSLGKRILRTETASLVVISNILYELEG